MRKTKGSERGRDEQRGAGTPRYGGKSWQVADERGARRFGHARNDSAGKDPTARPEVVSEGHKVGMGRGDHPRKSKDREK